MFMKKSLLFLFACIVSYSALACTVPNTFSSGTTASSTAVNANFAALAACITALESPPVAGTYTEYSFHTQVVSSGGSGGAQGQIDSNTETGTVTLNADGTASLNLSSQDQALTLNFTTGCCIAPLNTSYIATATSNTTVTPKSNGKSGTWSLSNGTLTIYLSGGSATFTETLNGRMFIAVQGPSNSNDIIVLVHN